MYDKIIALGKFYSDLDQTPQTRKMRIKLVGGDIVSADPKYTLYTKDENENTNRSVAM